MGGRADDERTLAGVLLVTQEGPSESGLRRSTVVVAVVFFLIIAVNVYWTWFVRAESTLYSWDHVAYWSMTSGLAERLFGAPLASLRAVARSIAEQELNLLPALPLAPFLSVFGSSRLAWVLTVTNVYAIPSLLLGWWAARKTLGRGRRELAAKSGWSVETAWLLATFWFVPLWEPVGLGYLGVGGLGLAFVVYGLTFARPAGRRREDDIRAVGVGIALALLVLFRRWYAFWAFGFCVVLAVDAGVRWVGERSELSQRFRTTFRRPLIVAASLIVTLLALAAPRVVTMLRTDYSDRFVHYDSLTTAWSEVANLIARFGVLALLLTGLVGLLALKCRSQRRPVLMIAGQIVVTALMFRQVQDPSPQHWYLLIPGLLMVMAIGLATVPLVRWMRWGIVAGAVFSCVGVLGPGPGFPAPFGSSVKIRPSVRNDLDEIGRMLRFLDGRVAVGARWVYVLSGTGVVSGSGLGHAQWSLGATYPSCARVLQTDQVDLRDGFPDGLLAADIVLLPLPVQVRGDGETQRVVSLPAEDFRNNTGVAQAFTRLPVVFSLDEGVVVQVFERVRPNTPSEVVSLSERLRIFYPENTFVFTPADFRMP